MSDDLDYMISFPWRDEGQEPIHKTKEPVVFILGWINCEDEELSDYSQIYEQFGCVTIRYHPGFLHLLFSQGKLKRASSQLLSVLDDYELEEHPIIFHVLGHGGDALLRHVIETLRTEDQFKRLNIMGIIYDSSPVKSGFGAMVKAYFRSAKMNMVFKILVSIIYVPYLFLHFIFHLMKRIFGSGCNLFTTWDSLKDMEQKYPVLFLYSKTDTTASSKNVDEMAVARTNRKCDVTSVCWDNSPYLKHYAEHREVYIRQCRDFVVKVIAALNAQLMKK